MSQTQAANCFHCGIPSIEHITHDNKCFCCRGCKNAYAILSSHSLGNYYNLASNPGTRPAEFKRDTPLGKKPTITNPETFLFLDNPDIINDLVTKTKKNSQITLKLPSIHCTACVWVLENLHRIDAGVLQVRVNFLKREAKIVFDENITLRSLVELLASIGYTPELNLYSTEGESTSPPVSIRLIIQIAVAGFGFGNIMLFSLPEYLGLNWTSEIEFVRFFGYFNFLLAIPIVFFSGWDYFTSAWSGLKHRFISIDVPISLGIAVLFLRSTYEVVSGVGSGYFDSLAGLVFFLLLGRAFQEYTYHYLSFENDYRAYFPIAIHKRVGNTELAFPIKAITSGDELIIFPGQIIPVDVKLLEQNAKIDFSFVTGEADWVLKQPGEKIMAGGRNGNTKIVVVAISKFSQSSFMEVWNHELFSPKDAPPPTSGYQSILIKRISKSFTLTVIGLAIVGALYWGVIIAEPTKAMEVFTAVLIIACPCALALSSPITLGVGLRILQQNGLFVKNTESLEKAAQLDTIVFDKTGTLTTPAKEVEKFVAYQGVELSAFEIKALYTLTQYSSHPLSTTLNRYLKKIHPFLERDFDTNITIKQFHEQTGKGVVAVCGGTHICYGASDFVGDSTSNPAPQPLAENTNPNNSLEGRFSQVHIAVGNRYYGVFTIRQAYRVGLTQTLASLRNRYHLALLTGDNPGEEKNLQSYFQPYETLKFYQSPMDKLKWIQTQQQQGKKVLMLGDGLNDAGALKQSDVGIALTEDIKGFSPACDAILSASAFERIPQLLNLSRITHTVITLCLIISFTYNSVGLFFALSGKLSPLIAAILMPLSSISVVAFILVLMYFGSRKNNLKFI